MLEFKGDYKTISKIMHLKNKHLKKILKENKRVLSKTEILYKAATNRDTLNYYLKVSGNAKVLRETIFGITANIRAIEVRLKAISLFLNHWQVTYVTEGIPYGLKNEILLSILLDDFNMDIVARINGVYGRRKRMNNLYAPRVTFIRDASFTKYKQSVGSTFNVIGNDIVLIKNERVKIKDLLNKSYVTIVSKY